MKILRNIIRTPDGTLLESRTVHDYVVHKDLNGELYINDGGGEYLRRSVNKEPFEDLTVYSTDSIEKLRELYYWGSYGKSGDDYKVKYLKELSNVHIEVIIETQKHLSESIIDIFQRELDYRVKNNIFIED